MDIKILPVIDPISKKEKYILFDETSGFYFKGQGIKTGWWDMGQDSVKMFTTMRMAEFAQGHFNTLYREIV